MTVMSAAEATAVTARPAAASDVTIQAFMFIPFMVFSS
jgi:hypothetical protein